MLDKTPEQIKAVKIAMYLILNPDVKLDRPVYRFKQEE